MKKQLILFLLLFLSFSTYANKVDSLKTDKDVETFIFSQLVNKNALPIFKIKDLYRTDIQRKTAKKLGVKPWQKADFNLDGRTDLLVHFKFRGESSNLLVVFIDQGNYFSPINFSGFGFEEKLYYPIVYFDDKQPLLKLYRGCNYCYNNMKIIYDTATLIYKFGDFIEYVKDIPPCKIEKISITTSLCDGDCPTFVFSIDSNRVAKYFDLIYNNPDIPDFGDEYVSEVDSVKYAELIEIINGIDIINLHESYFSGLIGSSKYTLNITYNGGLTKRIEDHGTTGTYGLRMIYGLLFEIKSTQKWVKR
jgi:hypothetical protein